ncbi:unnamed protein product [Camellia sinensis]
MDDIYKLEKNAERWFRRMNPIHWTLCHDGGCRWGILTTNHIEGFNGVLKGARSVPITASVEITFYRLVKYFDEGRTIAENESNRGHLYTTNVQQWIDEHQAKANVHMLVPINRGIGEYEVRTAPHGMGGGARQIVSLRPPSCSCGKYTLFHLPCSHMLAVTADLGEDPFPFVAPEYRLEVHKRIFAQKFRPMLHEQYWPDNDYPTLLAIPARQREVKTGRPQHSRIHNEMDTSRQSGLHHCSLCLQRGHDKRKCPARIRSIRQSMTHFAEEIPLLTHQHRADTIWRQSAKDQPKLKCRRSDSGLWDTALDHRVLRCLLRAGFYGVYRIGPIRLDHHLVTTLVERWRIETRTFHFPVGESTVTLQDVAILFGLPVDGHAVTGKDPGNMLDDLIALY